MRASARSKNGPSPTDGALPPEAKARLAALEAFATRATNAIEELHCRTSAMHRAVGAAVSSRVLRREAEHRFDAVLEPTMRLDEVLGRLRESERRSHEQLLPDWRARA